MSERSLRCAIYTRKSTEEGLEQSFNTLQAQREAAEAYILSHRGEGWRTAPALYDDGGWSGASLERPALRKLLADIEARRIDCVVVYKVDRLSRSLLDFTRLLSLFEKRGVSFVSVTQDFNTGSSMGRLTLHILLSFAQFEREIVGERTRDKLSAARRKGKWIGGRPVLGYDVAPGGGRLVVNAAEAERVREIFALCAASSSLTEALEGARARGWTAKHWTSQRGRVHGGQLLSLSTLRLLVSNVLYRGEIRHKGVVYPGEHPALVSHELWLAVQARHQLERSERRHNRPVETRLKGLVTCAHCGGLLTASCTRRHGHRHVYYVCRAGKKREPACPQQPVLSLDLEDSLRERLEGRGAVPGFDVETLIRTLSYHSGTRRVAVELQEGSRFEYSLPVPVRPGVCRKEGKSQSRGRTGEPGEAQPDPAADSPRPGDPGTAALPSADDKGLRPSPREARTLLDPRRRLATAEAAVPCYGGPAQLFSRYTRSPARVNARTFRPCLRRLAERNPRTLCRCQPVSSPIWRAVAPSGRHSRAYTWAAFEPSRNGTLLCSSAFR